VVKRFEKVYDEAVKSKGGDLLLSQTIEESGSGPDCSKAELFP
jgi:hypothetical protein